MSVACTETTDKLDADRLLKMHQIIIIVNKSNNILVVTHGIAVKLTGCKLPSGVAFAEVSEATELTEDREDKTSETGATPKEDSISSKSLKNYNNSIINYYSVCGTNVQYTYIKYTSNESKCE